MAELTNDDFGAGLETEQTNAPVIEQNTGEDTFVSEFQSMFDVQSDAPITRESIAEYMTRMNTEAQEAAALREKVTSYEQQLAELASRQPEPPTQQTQAEAKAEAKRRYEMAKVDAHLLPFLQASVVDQDAQGYYKPKAEYQFNPQVLQACQAKNAQLQSHATFLNDLTSDPYAVNEELVSNSQTVRALQQQLAEFQKKIDERLAPIQQQTQETALVNFVRNNLPILSDPKDPSKWSPAGELFNRLVGEQKMSPEAALELVKPIANLSAPAPAKQTKKAPQRIEGIKSRMNGGAVRHQEVNAHGPLNGKRPWRMTMADVNAMFSENDN